MKKQSGEEQSIDANAILGENETSDDNEWIDTELSIHPDWKVPSEQKYVFAFHNNDCKPLKPNQLSLSGIDMNKVGNKYVFTAFIRQTLSKDIQLKETTILLLGPNSEKFARKEFDLSKVGTIPARSSRPWQFVFEQKDLLTNESIPKTGWTLAFELKKKHQLDLERTWKESLADEAIQSLEKIVANAAPLKPGEVNFMGISAKYNENEDLAVTVLIRNGSEKNLTLQQLPLKVEDSSGEVIVQGGFKLDEFEVKANTSKPWTFIFPQSLVTKKDADLSKWRVYPVQ